MHAIASKLQRKLKAGDTPERCGVVTKSGACPEKQNVHPQPDKGFMMPAQVMIDYEDKLIGTWHTHPGQSSALSHDDYLGFRQWPGLIHFIVGTDGVRAYRADDMGVIEEVSVAAN